MCYDPLKFILRFVICPPNVCTRAFIISFLYGMVSVCVYKSFRSRKVQHRASHRFRRVVVWDSWLRKLFYPSQLYTTIFVWRLGWVFCTSSRASFVVDPHVVDAQFADFIYLANILRTNFQIYDKASGLLNFKAMMATGCCRIFGILKLFMQPFSRMR